MHMNWQLFNLVTTSISLIIIGLFFIILIIVIVIFTIKYYKISHNIQKISKNASDLSDKIKMRADDVIENYDKINDFLKIVSRFFKK